MINLDKQQLCVMDNSNRLIDKIFKYYLYLVLVWVHLALAFDVYMIIKHFNEL